MLAKIHKRRTRKNIEYLENPLKFRENNYIFSGTCSKCGEFMWYDLSLKKYRPHEFDGDIFIHECGERYSPEKFKRLKDYRDYTKSQNKNVDKINIDLTFFAIIGMLTMVIGGCVWVFGGLYSLFSFIWNEGNIFSKCLVLCFDIGCFIIVGGLIYTLYKSVGDDS